MLIASGKALIDALDERDFAAAIEDSRQELAALVEQLPEALQAEVDALYADGSDAPVTQDTRSGQ